MRLLVFCAYYPPHTGGYETHAEGFNRHLAPKVEQIYVFTSRLPGIAKSREIKGKITIFRFPAFEIVANYPLPKFWAREFWQLWREVNQLPIDIVISRTRFFATSLMALVHAKNRHKRWVHIEHGSDYPQLNSRFKAGVAWLYDQTFGRLIFRWSDLNIAISQAARNFIKIFDSRVVPVIYRGVEIEKILAVAPDRITKKKYPHQTIISYVGRLIDGKGVTDLIQAIKQLDQLALACFIIGDGPQKPELEKFVKDLDLGGKVVFFGQQSLEKVIGLLKISDIFVNPSYTEGLPTSVIEAALSGSVIIATDVGGTREIIDHNQSGILIAPRDVVSLVTELKRLIKNPDLRENMAVTAEVVVKKKFTWDRSINLYQKYLLG